MKRLYFCVWATIGMIAVFFNGSVVTAFPPFKKSFQEKYVTEGPESLKTSFKKVKCNVCHQGKQALLSKEVDNSNDLKITIAFLNVERFSFDIDCIQSPSLLDMIKDTELKKNLWSKLKPFQKD